MPRRTRLKELSEHEVERFLADATAFFGTINKRQMRIAPSSAHYRALWALNDAVIEAIKAITGKDPPWMRPNTRPPLEKAD
jgi:membrane-associated PAP2 superfamily phosphatase